MLGSKGLGRQTIFRLGRSATIETKKEGNTFIKVGMDLPPKSALAIQKTRLEAYKYDFIVKTGKIMGFPNELACVLTLTMIYRYKPLTSILWKTQGITYPRWKPIRMVEKEFDVSLVTFGKGVS